MTGRVAKVGCKRCYGQGWVAVPAKPFGCYEESKCPECRGQGTRLGRVADAAPPRAEVAAGARSAAGHLF